MRIYYPAQLDLYVAAHYPTAVRPDGPIRMANDGDGSGPYIVEWPKELGEAPTPEEVAGWVPTPPDPDLAPAPSLERGDYKRMLTALDAASTVAQVKGVLRSYLAKRAAG